MMKRQLALLVLWPLAAPAQETNNLWIMWERLRTGPCADTPCAPLEDYRSHFLMNVPTAEASSFFNGMASSAQIYGNANLSHDSLPLCWDAQEPPEQTPTAVAAPNVLAMDYSNALATLRGLGDVHADLRGVRGPAEFKGQFGEEAHRFLVEEFGKAGIQILSKEDVAKAPGRPTLSMRFSPEVHGCRPWSVSLSLKQDLLLARDLEQMLASTTWSTASRQSEADPDFMPRDAMQNVIQRFVQDFTQAQKVVTPSDEN